MGRERELAQVDLFLDGIADGSLALVVEGEAGIGKTTVWREARRRAEARGGRVLAAHPAAAEAKLSFAALGDLLAGVDDDSFAALPAPQRESLEVALLRRKPTARGTSARAIAAGVLSLVRKLAAEQDLIVAIDDWQWLDLASRHVLEFVARRLEDERVGLLCSVRSPSAPPAIGGRWEGRQTRVVLGPLSLAALGRIIATQLGRSPPRPVLVQLARASSGNPFYALEMARLMGDRTPGTALPVPDDLRKLSASRIRRLPGDARDAVLLAAAISDADRRAIDADALAPAEEAGIVTVDAAGRIEFAHPLFASAAYGSITASERRELHRRAAERVDDPERRARHLALASERPDDEVAAQLDGAAAHAAARGAPEAAAELAELAAKLTLSNDPDASNRRLFEAARYHSEAGDLGRAEELAQEVAGDPQQAELGARALLLSSELAARRSNFIEARALAEAALGAAGEDPRLRAAIELDMVYCAVSLGDVSGALPHAQAAVAQAETAGDDGILADALAVLTMAEFLGGRGADEVRLQKALALEDPAGASAFIMRPRVIRGMLRLWTGELDEALEALHAVYEETIERGQEGTAPMLSFYLVWAEVWRGNFEQAIRLSDRALDAAALLEDPTTLGLALSARALAHAHSGHVETARTAAGEALELFERLQWRSGVVWPLWALGFAALSAGQPAAADALLGPLADQLTAMGAGDPVMASFLPDEIESLTALGELDRADGYLAPFEAAARRLDRAWAVAAAERCRGLLAAARGNPQAAFAALERAFLAHDHVSMPFERARTLLIAGEVYRRFKQRGRARELLSEALSEFERVGAPLWAQRAQGELARIGRPGGSGGSLSETEQRIAELAASGLSNQEVAERAFLSVKTVEANLTRIYRKLGVRSRTGLVNALRGSAGLESRDSEGREMPPHEGHQTPQP